MTFDNAPALLREALATRGYSAPTPVQAAVLEPEADGRDLIVSAQTGSGKTVAFGLALAPQLLDEFGTGRVMFRNTRAALSGFPTRQAKLVPLKAGADDDAFAGKVKWLAGLLRELAAGHPPTHAAGPSQTGGVDQWVGGDGGRPAPASTLRR